MLDEVKAMGELMLDNFASALMHSAAFPEYPVRGLDRTIMFHLRRSPALRDLLAEYFDRFPFTGLSMLCYKHVDRAGVEAELERLTAAATGDEAESARRRELLRIFGEGMGVSTIQFTTLSMQQRR
jgi:hypothetical protein